MELQNSVLLQKQVRDNSEDLQSEFLNLRQWEEQMRRADADLRKKSSDNIVIPPIRSKNKKKSRKKKNKGNAESTNDNEQPCEEAEDGSDSNEFSKKLPDIEMWEQVHNKAIALKNQGNVFVQQQEWKMAITYYDEAIRIYPFDPAFYANRALCALKLNNLQMTEIDCTTALQIDETYVKAYHRRALASIGLKQYEEAKRDLNAILNLEASNKEAKSLLMQVEKDIERSKVGVIGKTDHDDVPIEKEIGKKMFHRNDMNMILKDEKKDDQINLKIATPMQDARDPRIPDWLPEKDDVAVVEPIEKRPHLRMKKPMLRIPVEDAVFASMGCKNNTDIEVNKKNAPLVSPQTICNTKENDDSIKLGETSEEMIEVLAIPRTSVQFLIDWRRNKSSGFRYKYLKQLDASILPELFQDSMEYDIFAEILDTLNIDFTKRGEAVFSYLQFLSEVKRFRALVMFVSAREKEGLKSLFEYCENVEKVVVEDIAVLRGKYEV